MEVQLTNVKLTACPESKEMTFFLKKKIDSEFWKKKKKQKKIIKVPSLLSRGTIFLAWRTTTSYLVAHNGVVV